MAEKNRLFPALRWIALAAVAGALAGAVAVYVSGGSTGNMEAPTTTASAQANSAADRACEAKLDLAARVGEAAGGEVAAMLGAERPQSLSSLAFNAPDGQPMTLADLGGKTVLLNLWATWCAPCREEMPALDALQRERGSDSFEVVAVNIDTGDDSKPAAFLEETGVSTLARYRDASLGIFNDLKGRALALGLPVTLLIDGDGCLLAHMNGPAEWHSDDANRLLDAAQGS